MTNRKLVLQIQNTTPISPATGCNGKNGMQEACIGRPIGNIRLSRELVQPRILFAKWWKSTYLTPC